MTRLCLLLLEVVRTLPPKLEYMTYRVRDKDVRTARYCRLESDAYVPRDHPRRVRLMLKPRRRPGAPDLRFAGPPGKMLYIPLTFRIAYFQLGDCGKTTGSRQDLEPQTALKMPTIQVNLLSLNHA